VTGSEDVEREASPRLYNLVENLCISRGLPVPRVRIMDTPVLNAFATGMRSDQYAITVTRGLVEALDDAELEAVLAHELTHIRNRDVQLLVIAAVFVGIISLVGDLIVRAPRALLYTSGRSRGYSGSSGGGFGGGSSSSSGSSRGGKGGGGAIILILVAVAIFLLARVLAIALRMAVSRKREYLADAGSVELTRNPDAMIGALRKISGHSEIEAPNQVRAMFIDYPERAGFASFFATHPPIESRIEALVRYAGGLDLPVHPELPPAPPPVPEGPSAEPPANPPAGPWG
jgi:heat shock protein HtpX